MIRKKSLGVFLGVYSLSAVEIENQKTYRTFSAVYNSPESADSKSDQNVSNEIKITAVLQKNLRDLKVTATDVSLSLPSQDIIFRSFSIPWMTPSEIKSVVDFESRKYIPFKLADLTYTFHPIVMTNKQEKSIRVLLTAIKSDVLDGYCRILENSGLHIKFIEPSPVSLLRVLVFKKLLPRNQRIVIVQSDDKEGKIIIIDQGIPQFIRDFQLFSSGGESDSAAQTPDLFNVRLFNEIKISLDYYARQNPQEKVNAILTLLAQENNDLSQLLGKEFGLPVTSLNAQSILNTPSPITVDLLSAYGIGLKSLVALPVAFDLPRKMVVRSQRAISPLEKILLDLNYILLAQVSAICFVVVVTSFFLFSQPVNEQKKKLSAFTVQQGNFESSSKEDIKKRHQETMDKWAGYKSVRTKSDVFFFLSTIPKLLPEGTWITNLTIDFIDQSSNQGNPPGATPQSPEGKNLKWPGTKVTLNLTGRVFVENTNHQLRMVKMLVANLKEDKEFASFFEDINFTANASNITKYPLTLFNVKCK